MIALMSTQHSYNKANVWLSTCLGMYQTPLIHQKSTMHPVNLWKSTSRESFRITMEVQHKYRSHLTLRMSTCCLNDLRMWFF